jgi:hypothetical protein
VARQDTWSQGMTARIVDEVDCIIAAFAERGITVVPFPDGRGLGYMYAEGDLLVLEQHLEDVRVSLLRQDVQILPPRQPKDGEPTQEGQAPQGDVPQDGEVPQQDFTRILPGLVLLRIAGPAVPTVVEGIDQDLGEGCATPNHVFTVAGNGGGYNPDETVGPCAATDPEEVIEGTEPYPGICHCNSGAGVRVYIADTGLIPDTASYVTGNEVVLQGGPQHPWLAGVRGDEDPLSPGLQGELLKPYAGHGTFVAGVMRCIAPAADIYVGNVFKTAGSALETDFVPDLQRALNRGTDIFHISVASTTRKNLTPLSFWTWLEQLRKHKGIVCVAPAGNSGSRRPHWPGASPEVASVGALAADWRNRASFSNYGGWVDAYAPGRNLINAYGNGRFDCSMFPHSQPEQGQEQQEPQQEQHRQGHAHRYFYGMAQWSGTSFSSPILTGLIADRMWRNGENGIEAAAAILRAARYHAIPGVGAIVLPCGEDRGCRCTEDRGCRCADTPRLAQLAQPPWR